MSETAVMTLTDFLLARIAEDEAAANAADMLSSWRLAPGPGVRTADGDKVAHIALETVPRSRTYLAEHIARHDPARVLAECEAKRRIMAEAGGGGTEDWDVGWDAGLDRTLRLLAAVYADHPDFQEEWRP